MAKKSAPKSAAPAPKPIAAKSVTPAIDNELAPIAVTDVRKTVSPKTIIKKAPAPVTHERIAERAYYISRSVDGGSQDHNWFRAEGELKNENSN